MSERQEVTEFQTGLRHFSVLLVQVAGVLTSSIFVINLVLQRPLLESLLFSLAIAVGITPQLLPAVVTTSLATGSRRLAQQGVLVKRLVCIEDLGDIEILLTDKTGTLTEGHISFVRAVDLSGTPDDEVFRLGLLCNEATVEDGHAVGGNPLDVALWQAPGTTTVSLSGVHRLARVPFDHDRRMSTVLIDDAVHGRLLVTKGAPESVLAACVDVAESARATLDAEFAAGGRVVAVATRPAPGADTTSAADEHDLTLVGYLVFLDQPKLDAAASLKRLADLGITVKVVTGDNAVVAEKVCRDLGLDVGATMTGTDIAALDDDALRARVIETTIFARVSPEQKARLIRAHRAADRDVAFLGDGVNDAVALHAADVGISVESAADVAKDAADIVLLEKDLGVLADGVSEGRRTFANTIKYVLMGTSSNFGNMFSAAVASTFLSFLPMLPSQILLNNLLYDSSQMAIPTDLVDPELVARPSHWDIKFIRRFMVTFGPISSIFDFATFAIMLGPFAAGPALFRSGWFVESLATQTLVVFVIRTHRVPFWRSRPSRPLLGAVFAVVIIGALLPYSPFAHDLGFTALPLDFFAVLAGMVVLYLLLVEITKRRFFEHVPRLPIHNARRNSDVQTDSAAVDRAGFTTSPMPKPGEALWTFRAPASPPPLSSTTSSIELVEGRAGKSHLLALRQSSLPLGRAGHASSSAPSENGPHRRGVCRPDRPSCGRGTSSRTLLRVRGRTPKPLTPSAPVAAVPSPRAKRGRAHEARRPAPRPDSRGRPSASRSRARPCRRFVAPAIRGAPIVRCACRPRPGSRATCSCKTRPGPARSARATARRRRPVHAP